MDKKLREAEAKLKQLISQNLTSGEIELIRDYSDHWNLFNEVLGEPDNGR